MVDNSRSPRDSIFHQLADAGFGPDLIPIIPPGATLASFSKVKPESRGKVPGRLLDDGTWCGFADFTSHYATEDDLATWATWQGAGAGIIGRRVPGLDHDITNAVLAEECHALAIKMLGQAPKRVGKAPKFLLPYRCAELLRFAALKLTKGGPKNGGEKHLIEIRGALQQWVAGGIHPGTGQPYRYEGRVGHYDKLTIVTLDQLMAYFDAVVKLAEAEGYTVTRLGGIRPLGTRAGTAPGSAKEAETWSDDDPQWFPAKEGRQAAADFIPNHEVCRKAVASYLGRAEPAEEDGGGEPWTLAVARRCMDFGCTPPVVKDLMLADWNERCSPPWDADDLWIKVFNAWAYSHENAIGCDAPSMRTAEETWGDNPSFNPILGLDRKPVEWPTESPGWPLKETSSPSLSMDAAGLPKVLAAYAFDRAAALGCPPCMTALPLILAAALALGNEIAIQPTKDPSYTERPTLWGALVAPSGSAKSPALKLCTDALDPIEARWQQEDKHRYARFKQDEELYKKRFRDWKEDVNAHGVSIGADPGVPIDPPGEPIKPPHRQIKFMDTTTEALGDILKDNPRGVIGIFDEVVTLLGGFDAYRPGKGISKDRGSFLTGWSGARNHRINRKGAEPMIVPNWQFSLLGGVQTRKLTELAARGNLDNDGFIQRFLIAYADDEDFRPPGEPDREPDHYARLRFLAAVEALAGLAVPEKAVVYSPEAVDIRAQFERYVFACRMRPDIRDAYKEWLAKAVAQFDRLALVFHALEHVSRPMVELGVEDIGPLPPAIPAAVARRAEAYMAEVQMPGVAKVLDAGNESETTPLGRIVNTILAGKRTKIAVRDIYRAHHDLSDKRDVIQEVMDFLEAMGWVVPIQAGRWRHMSAWAVNPAVYSTFGREAKAAAERKARLKALAAKYEREATRRKDRGRDEQTQWR